MLKLVRLNGVTQIHHLKRKDRRGHVKYWKAQCGETRPLRLDGGKERKLLPIRTMCFRLLRETFPEFNGETIESRYPVADGHGPLLGNIVHSQIYDLVHGLI